MAHTRAEIDMSAQHWITDVYIARCKDTGTSYVPDDAVHFKEAHYKQISGPTIDLRGKLLGIHAAMAIGKVLRTESFTALDLYGNVIRDSGTSSICQLIADNPSIKSLNIGCNDLGDRAGRSIVEMIEKSKSLRFLELGREPEHFHDNSFTGVTGQTLFKTLRDTNNTLTALSLNGNAVGAGAEGGKAIVELGKMLRDNSTLSTLRLGQTGLGNKGALVIARELRDNHVLAFLDLHGNGITEETGTKLGEMLSANKGLVSLDLRDNALGPASCFAFANSLRINETLVSVNLAGAAMGSGMVMLCDALQYNNSLTSLNVARNDMRPTECQLLAEAISKNPVLTFLDASGNHMGDGGAEMFAHAIHDGVSPLTTLLLNSAKIGDYGGESIAIALEENSIMTTLSMKDNFLSEGGGKRIAESLTFNKSLTRVVLSGNQINHNTILAVQSLCTRNKVDGKAKKTVPLENEIVRLMGQQHKLREKEQELKALFDDKMNLQTRINNTEDDVQEVTVNMQSDEVEFSKQIEDQTRIYKEISSTLAQKEKEIAAIQDEYSVKFAEVSSELEVEEARKAQLSEKLNTTVKALDEGEKALTDQVRRIEAEIEAARQKRAELEQRAAQRKQEFEELLKKEEEARMEMEAAAEVEAAAARAAKKPKKVKKGTKGKRKGSKKKAPGSSAAKLGREVDALLSGNK